MTAAPIASRGGISDDYRTRDGKPDAPVTLPWSWAEQRLAAATNYWVTTTGQDGLPHPRPLWGLWHEASFLFTVMRSTRTARNLAADPRASVHLESATEVVIMTGTVIEEPLDHQLEAHLGVWLEKYAPEGASAGDLAAPADRAIYRLTPRQAHGWTLDAFPSDLTRWRFAT